MSPKALYCFFFRLFLFMVLSKSTNTEPFYKCGARCFKKIGFAAIFDALFFIVIMFSRWYSIPEEEAYRRYLQNLS